MRVWRNAKSYKACQHTPHDANQSNTNNDHDRGDGNRDDEDSKCGHGSGCDGNMTDDVNRNDVRGDHDESNGRIVHSN